MKRTAPIFFYALSCFMIMAGLCLSSNQVNAQGYRVEVTVTAMEACTSSSACAYGFTVGLGGQMQSTESNIFCSSQLPYKVFDKTFTAKPTGGLSVTIQNLLCNYPGPSTTSCPGPTFMVNPYPLTTELNGSNACRTQTTIPILNGMCNGFSAFVRLEFKWTPTNTYPITPSINATNNVYCEDETLTLNANSGYSGYTWKFDDATTSSFINYNSGSAASETISITDLYGANYQSKLGDGNAILFSTQLGSCAPVTTSAPVRFYNRQALVADYTTCAADGSNSGYVTVNSLNRTVNAGETFNITIYNGGVPIDSETGISSFPFTFPTPLAPGNYSFYVETQCGDIAARTPFTVYNDFTPSWGVTNHVSCNGGSNGLITVSASGGSGSFQYNINGGAYQSSGTFSNLTAGSYPVSIKDVNSGCIKSNTFTVTQPSAVTINSLSPTAPGCSGIPTGTITINASGGTGALSYSIDNGASYQSSNIFSGLAPGNYNAKVRDANLCTSTTMPVTVGSYPPAIAASASSITNVSCNGGTNGSITVTASGGTGALMYSRGGAFQASNIFSGLSAATYVITVRDANNCTFSFNATVTQPAAISASSSSATPSCVGGSDGTVTVNASGGAGGFTYSKDGTTFQSSNILTGFTAGTHVITVKDQNNCTFGFNATVGVPTAITASASATSSPSCVGGTNGTVTVNASGGAGGFTYSKDGVTFQASNVLTGFSAGTYTITVKDSKSCLATFNTTINPPTAINATTSFTKPTCFGLSDGTITVSAAGGAGGFTYSKDGITFQVSNILSGFAAGTHSVVVKDQNGCTASFSATVTQPAAVSASASSVTQVTCNGGNNGSITVSASGGTGTLFYSKDGSNFQSSNIFNGLTAATYTITVKDQNNCLVSFSVSITQPAAINATTTTTAVNCNGGADGSITVNASNGVSPYSYSINGTTFQSSNVFSGLTASAYTVTIRDANLCSVTRPASVSQPSTAVSGAIVQSSPINCKGQANGALNLTPSGGTSPYTFVWSHGPTTEDVSGLAAGNYSVEITDSKGCKNTVNYTLIEPALLSVTHTLSNYNGTPIRCNGDANGQINLTASGGTGPYTYTWSTGATTEDLSGLSAGTYTVTVKDSRNCSANSSITLTQPQSVVSSISMKTNVSCAGGNNGSITVAPGGGTGSYSYSINGGSSWQTSATFTNLSAGSYTILIQDVNGCSSSLITSVSSPAALVLSVASKQDTQCGAANGSAQVNASGGAGGYIYRWRDASATIISTTNTISNVASGSYTAEATDQNGCIVSIVVVINSSNGPIVSVTSMTPASCSDKADGSATISVNGGKAPYTILWPNGQTTATATNLTASAHVVTVTDQDGCKTLFPVTITSPAAINVQSTTLQNPSCAGLSNGIVQVSVTGGTSSYSLLWSTGGTTNRIENRSAGNYSIAVTDSKGCTGSKTFTLTDPAVLTVQSVSVQPPSCAGFTNGSIEVQATGGNGNYSYSWNTGQTTSQLTNLASGTYTVTATDQLGCNDAESITITAPQPLVIASILQQHPSCFGFSDGSIEVIASGGNGVYSYQWNTGNTGNKLENRASGSYNVTITDNKGCAKTSGNIVLNDPPVLTLALNSSTNPTCHGTANGKITVQAAGGTAPYSYLWDNGAGGAQASTFPSGTHTVTVSDQNGCNTSLSATLLDPPLLVLQAVNIQSPTCVNDADGFIETSASGGTGSISFKWSTGAMGNLLSGVRAGSYTATVTDQNGCSVAKEFVVSDPAPLALDLGPDQTVCPGQSLNITPGIANVSYQWTGPNGFVSTSGPITATAAGIYTLKVTDNKGCQAEDDLKFMISDQLLKADLLMASEAYVGDTVAVIDISWPMPESIQWDFGNQASIIYSGPDFALITFDEAGTYNVTVDAILSGCRNAYSQSIKILEGKDESGGRKPQQLTIVEYTVHPNPFRDAFKIDVTLTRPATLQVQLVHMGSNQTVMNDTLEENISHQKEYKNDFVAGVYILILKAGKELKTVRVLKL
jgi:hypothetical protein